MLSRNLRLLNHWKSSPYYLEETVEKNKAQTQKDILTGISRRPGLIVDQLINFVQHRSSNFPAELVKDPKELLNPKSALECRCSIQLQMTGLQKLDLFEKLEQKYEGQEDKYDKKKKEGEDENEEDDEAAGEVEEEYSDDRDYNQNIDFDDDKDDFNMDDGNDATY